MFKLLRRGRGTRAEVANICWIIEKARKFQKNIYLSFIDYAKAFDCVDHNKLWKTLKEMGIPDYLTCLIPLYGGCKGLLMRMKEESEKVDLKLNIQKTKIMASALIISWQIEREKVETVTDFIFLGSKITADSACSHEKMLLGREAMTNLDSVLKSGDLTLSTKVCIIKAMVFPVVGF